VTELLLRPLADAFLQVGVPVALLVAAAAWAQVRYGARALDVLVRHRRAAPALGAAVGVTPGCGGAILAVGLYLKGRASYGTAVAALTATMGDASFVLLAVDLRVGLLVHGALLVAGVVTGYAVDALGWDPRRGREPALATSALSADGAPSPGTPHGLPPAAAAAFSVPCDDAAAARRPVLAGLPAAPALLWLLTAGGALLAAPAALGRLDPLALPALAAGLDLWVVIGVLGFVACLVVFLQSGCRLRDDGEHVPADVPTALRHGAVELAFVVFWVSVAFVALAVLEAVLPWDGGALPLLGLTGVLVGVAVAVVPGCGTQIAFTGLWASGALPLPALLANAVAQDGDALLPMLARDRRAAVLHDRSHLAAGARRRHAGAARAVAPIR
jgi:hypothetical protein